jgi:uncharacterized repeat protein (TIGR03803 family)
VRTLASFTRTTGAEPNGGLTSDAQGDLFGTTYKGGMNGRGTVFEIPAGSSNIIKVAAFNGTDGAHPLGPLTIDAAGNLYGTTTAGGATGQGTIFAIATGSGKITRLASFQNGTGQKPTSALVRDVAGNLIGTAQNGGTDGKGTIFELPAGTNSIKPLVVFTGANGAKPTGSLMVDTQGNIMGTTARGGQYNKGTVFEITPGG